MKALDIGYKGTVNIKQYRKGKLIRTKKLKNEGTSRLFYILCMYLCGRASDATWLPTFLDIAVRLNTKTKSDEDLNFESILNSYPRLNMIPPTDWVINSLTPYKISYQTTITSAYIGNLSGKSGILYFLLRDGRNEDANSNKDNILAYVSTGDWEASQWYISSDDVYIISWDLEIGNNTSTITTNSIQSTEATKTATTVKTSRTRKVTKNA